MLIDDEWFEKQDSVATASYCFYQYCQGKTIQFFYLSYITWKKEKYKINITTGKVTSLFEVADVLQITVWCVVFNKILQTWFLMTDMLMYIQSRIAMKCRLEYQYNFVISERFFFAPPLNAPSPRPDSANSLCAQNWEVLGNRGVTAVWLLATHVNS